MANQNAEDIAARLMQMKINTRLTALQAAQTLMGTPGYKAGNDTSGTIDHITLLAIATDIEKYIIGDLEEETKKALEEAKKPKANILQVRN